MCSVRSPENYILAFLLYGELLQPYPNYLVLSCLNLEEVNSR